MIDKDADRHDGRRQAPVKAPDSKITARKCKYKRNRVLPREPSTSTERITGVVCTLLCKVYISHFFVISYSPRREVNVPEDTRQDGPVVQIATTTGHGLPEVQIQSVFNRLLPREQLTLVERVARVLFLPIQCLSFSYFRDFRPPV